jgi:hypothetical protein
MPTRLKVHTYVSQARRLAELPQGIRELGAALGIRERNRSPFSEKPDFGCMKSPDFERVDSISGDFIT